MAEGSCDSEHRRAGRRGVLYRRHPAFADVCGRGDGAVFVHRCAERAGAQRGEAAKLGATRLPRLDPVFLVALLTTLVLLFGFQGEAIIANSLVIALIAVPILIQIYFNAELVDRCSERKADVAKPVTRTPT